MDFPTTIADIDNLIAAQVQENLHLDYKSSQAISDSKFDELAKDVSAFANSDGGILIYGVEENGHLPIGKDSGVDHQKYNRERIENIITSRIYPRLDDVVIVQIPLSLSTSIYSINVPRSFRGPHQASDKKYYKRFNFKSEPMEDYEIRDVQNRRRTVPPLVNVDIELEQGFLVYLIVTNIGGLTAEDVSFTFSSELQPWIDKSKPNIFTRGIKYLPPKRTYKFMYDGINEALHEDRPSASAFEISVRYLHPEVNQYISDVFHIDLMDYWNSSVTFSETYEQGKKLKEAIDKLTSEVKVLNNSIKSIASISGPTGLDLSISTLRNLKHLLAGEGKVDKINPTGYDYQVFIEVLGVDRRLAYRLQDFFRRANKRDGLSEIEGISGDVIERIENHFILADDFNDE